MDRRSAVTRLRHPHIRASAKAATTTGDAIRRHERGARRRRHARPRQPLTPTRKSTWCCGTGRTAGCQIAAASAGTARPQLQLPRRIPARVEEVHPPAGRGRAHGHRGAEGSLGDWLRRSRVRADRSLDGRRFQDVYAINLDDRRAQARAAKTVRWYQGPSPDGLSFLFYEGGHYHVYSMDDRPGAQHHAERADRRSSTPKTITTSSIRPLGVDRLGERQQVGVAARQLGHLAGADGRRARRREPDRQRARRTRFAIRQRFAVEPPQDRDKGIDLSKPQYFRAYGEWTKKAGIARVDPRQARRPDADVGRRVVHTG